MRWSGLTDLASFIWDDALPVYQCRQDFLKLLDAHQVIVVAGETGSGKTTQLPKLCLLAGRGSQSWIGCTQPRRIAARTVAQRVAEETQTPLGELVGFKIRFSDQLTSLASVKFMTDGILLAEIPHDRLLKRYDTLIIDEAHERSLNIDFLLGYIKQILPQRPDLKIIISSATIDTQRFSQYFNSAPVLAVSGRLFPVSVRYQPLGESSSSDFLNDVSTVVSQIVSEDRQGDILVFLTGEREIQDLQQMLQKRHAVLEVLPLYARLPASRQTQVFKPGAKRRIILATNVAETSITVPRIRYVIDPGLARVSRYGVKSRMQRLPIEKISQSAANQRKGRCGRVSDGICIRLYSEADFLSRDEFTEAEIHRSPLASVLLTLKSWRLGDVDSFPFIEAPAGKQVRDATRLLHELGAINNRQHLTRIGRDLARFPADPSIARMILAAGTRPETLRDVLIIAAFLGIQDIRERPFDQRQQADQQHQTFVDKRSDFLTVLNLWDWLQAHKKSLSNNRLRKICREYFLSYVRFLEWQDVHTQLKSVAIDLHLSFRHGETDYDALHQALLSGLLTQVAMLDQQKHGGYQGVRNSHCQIFPGSALSGRSPRWIMAAERLETSQAFARMVAEIKPEWVEKQVAHLSRHHYADPYWDARSGRVKAKESIHFYGLPLVLSRRVDYSQIDPPVCRELFIREALVKGDGFGDKDDFMRRNQALLREIRQLEEKTRQADLLVDDDVQAEFYHSRIPSQICTLKAFRKWWKKTQKKQPECLDLEKDQLMKKDIDEGCFPEEIIAGGIHWLLGYRFDPGSQQDGVFWQIPVDKLLRLENHWGEWLVPGLLEEKVTAMIKSLPKSIRRFCVPAPEYAQAAVEHFNAEGLPYNQALTQCLGDFLKRKNGVTIVDQDWSLEKLSDHLLMHYRVLSENGREMAVSTNLSDLQSRFSTRSREVFQKTVVLPSKAEKTWCFGKLPQQDDHGFPALKAVKDGVVLIHCPDQQTADETMRAGLVELFLQGMGKRSLQKAVKIEAKSCLRYTALGDCEALKADLLEAVIAQLFMRQSIRAEEEFQKALESGKGQFITALNALTEKIQSCLAYHQELKSLLSALAKVSPQAVNDMQQQLSDLVYNGFVKQTPDDWRPELSRYLRAMIKRCERVRQNPLKDQQKWQQYAEVFSVYEKWSRPSQEATEMRWLLEEYRVSLFAPELGTRYKVSSKRLLLKMA
jgi:ATP-dependent helicase HrpA